MAEPTDVPRSWVGQDVVIWAPSEGRQFEDAHGLIVAGYDQAMGKFSGRLEGVNDLEAVMNLLRSGLLMRKTGYQQGIELSG